MNRERVKPRERVVWLDGHLGIIAEGTLPRLDRDPPAVEGLFETIRVTGGKPRLWRRHLERLAGSAAALGFPAPPAPQVLERAVAEVLAASRLAEAAVRITLAAKARGGVCWVEADPLEARSWAGVRAGKAAAMFAKRPFEPGPHSRHKSTARRAYDLARHEARAYGADEALLVSPDGFVLEGSVSNVFAVLEGAILTPPLAARILPGIMRARVFEACVEHGLQAREAVLDRDRLLAADEVFLTNAIQGVVPLALLEGQPIAGRAVALELMQICDRSADVGSEGSSQDSKRDVADSPGPGG